MKTFLASACTGAAVFLTACAVGPNFKAPQAPPAAAFQPPGEPSTQAAPPSAAGQPQKFVDGADISGQWWTVFGSAQLNALIEQALAHSPTLDAAQATLRQANEIAAAQAGSLYPSSSATAQSQRQKNSGAAFGFPRAGSSIYTLNNASVNVSYVLDAFGGVRRQVEALRAEAEYQQFALEASYLSLTANIVTAAVNEASLRAQLAATEDIGRSQRLQLNIAQRRVDAGAASRTDVLQQQATLQATLANLPTLRSQLAQQRNQLAAYVGTLPANFSGGEFTLDSLTLPHDLPISLPSKFVEQRPDVRQYSALLHQATAQIGVATANMLPQITLSGSIGGQAGRFSDVFSPTSVVWSLAAAAAQPLFRGGTLLHQRRAAVAAAQAAASNYQATVITAFQNVSNTLYALQADAEALAAQSMAETTAAEALRLVQAQYQSGGASYVQILSSQQSYQSAAVALIKARAQQFADTAALFQALGGGWWNRTDVAVNSVNCCKEHL